MANEEVYGGAVDALLLKVTSEVFDDSHGAVPPAGAAYPQGEVSLALGRVSRDEEGKKGVEVGEELSGVVLAEHGVADGLVVPVRGLRFGS